MTVGPRDAIDKKLAKMYANVQTSNFNLVSAVAPDKMMNNLHLVAMTNRAFLEINRKII